MHPHRSSRRALALFLPATVAALAVGIWIGGFLGEGGAVARARSAVEQPVESPGVFASVCGACHGAAGEGKRELMTPAIASLPRWYVEEQLRQFREGHRGVDSRDVEGQMMRATLLALPENAVAEAVDTLLALPPA